MADQNEREARKELLEEKIAPIAIGLLNLAEEFQADFFFVVDAPQLGLYERVNRVQRLTTVERFAAELKEVQADCGLVRCAVVCRGIMQALSWPLDCILLPVWNLCLLPADASVASTR